MTDEAIQREYQEAIHGWDEEMERNGVGGVMRAFAFVLIDREHDPRAVIDGLIEAGGLIEGQMWDTTFGPAADEIARQIGLPPYPEES